MVSPAPISLVLRDDADDCGSGGGADTLFGLRIGSVFIILLCSMTGALFPVLSVRYSKYMRVPEEVFDFAKWFGSGVIIATAFIHLLSPALDELGSPCLDPAWAEYPYALALCLLSIFGIFLAELVAFRWGTAKLAKIGIVHDPHGHGAGAHAAHGPENGANDIETTAVAEEKSSHSRFASVPSLRQQDDTMALDTPISQIIGVAILEFGVVLHSVLIGLTLAVDPDFKILFVVIIFHQTFEGLGIGSRLAYMKLAPAYRNVPVWGALLYGITTPVGIAAGLGVRSTYNPDSTTASIVSGVMDALSSGILIYTGMVELLAHEILFNKAMQNASNWKLARSVVTMLFGCGIMALLGKWA
ncbi:hypothetical protein D9757_005250 [Collybiopsis confluens]|uniref:Uncharacterized protein n=1 Tax=Collybiopsis confluens TaxID=2823264 RepID=A0A8H5HWH4_9AGAR|nr:hypothetical protein D9757_005250 [Collybiopsis confluens]